MDREPRPTLVRFFHLVAIGSLALAACAPKSVEPTPTQMPNLEILISPEKGKWVVRTGAIASDAGAVGNEAVRLGLTSDALMCATSLSVLPPFILNENAPWASEFPRSTESDLTKPCLDLYIASMSK